MKVLFTNSVSITAVLDLLIMILSALHKILCVPLVTVTFLQHLHTIIFHYKDIKSGHLIQYYPDFLII